MTDNLTPREADLLAALASTSGRSIEQQAREMTRNGRDLSEAINTAAHSLMSHNAYAG